MTRITPGKVTVRSTKLLPIGSGVGSGGSIGSGSGYGSSGSGSITPLRPDAITSPSTIRRYATAPYDAGSTGRRNRDWNSTRLGQNTLLVTSAEIILARCREAVRNNPWATAAIDRWESNVVSTGIRPHFSHPDPKIKTQIQSAWDRWAESQSADYLGQNNFYTLQAVAAREVFEAGEVFARYRLRPRKDKLYIPFQLQMIEAEQLPIYRNILQSRSGINNSVRMGIEMDPEMRRVKYHFYAEHPGEGMLYPQDSMQIIEIPADQIQHVYRPIRAGQLRGEPRLVSVLQLLYDLDKYEDAALVKKQLAAMIAGIITKPAPETDIMPPSSGGSGSGSPNNETPPANGYYGGNDLGTSVSKLETGTFQELLPGEEISFANSPDDKDFEPFIDSALHKFAAGCGLTFEQITGNLKGVNYSSIRAGMLEFRRSCEQYQGNVMVSQFCSPVMQRWMREAVLCGRLDLPGFVDDPTPYYDCIWVAPGWAWVDPLKESQAAVNDIRGGLSSRTMVVRAKGQDPELIDAQQSIEHQRADDLGLVYTSDASRVLLGREAQPLVQTDPEPDEEAEKEAGAAGGDESQPSDRSLPRRKLSPRVIQAPKQIPARPSKSNPKLPVQ